MIIVTAKLFGNDANPTISMCIEAKAVFEVAFILQNSSQVERFIVRSDVGDVMVESDFGYAKLSKWTTKLYA